MNAALRASEVFTPGSFPTYTYVKRRDAALEEQLRDALETRGHLVSLVGPSKSGKTVLVEKVVGSHDLVVVTGAGIAAPDQLWERILDVAHHPTGHTAESARTFGGSAEIGVEGGTSIWGLITGKAAARGGVESARTTKESTAFGRRGLEDVIELFADGSKVVLIDDFHYMDRAVQVEATKALKEAARRGLKAVVSSVSHRADDIGRANPEMRGRVELIEIEYWHPEELARIAQLGFAALNVAIHSETIAAFAAEAAGSPQLMQLICLNMCRDVGLRQRAKRLITVHLSAERARSVFRRTARAADYRSQVEVMRRGPRVRGTDRKQYEARLGWRGDVYSIVLSATAADPPRLSFDYEELTARARDVCAGDAPPGASITVCCAHMHELALKRFPGDRVIDWDEQKQILSIVEPYFLFYLRWSGKLEE